MNRPSFFAYIALSAAFFSAVVPWLASSAHAESITSYSVNLTLDKDARLFVDETIDYDFGSNERHGIFRTIPIRYQGPWFTLFNLRTSVNDVATDGDKARYTTQTSGNDLMLKIGDPDATITGIHTYELRYSAERAVRRYGDEAELYWNAIGNDWPVAIASSSVILRLPSSAADNPRLRCFIGVSGSTEPCASINRAGSVYTIKPGRELSPGEGVTLALRVPAQSLTERSASRRALWFVQDNFLLFSPLAIALICLLIWLRWGKDPNGRGTVIAQYEPPQKLSPLEIGTMIDQTVDQRDIAAMFIDWATRGFITIREVEGKKLAFEFEKKTDPKEFSTPQEQALFNLLFAKGATYRPSPDSAVYTALANVKNATYQALVKKGLFAIHPSLMRTAFTVAGSFIGFGGGIFFSSVVYPGGSTSILAFFAMLINGAIIAFTGHFMPRATAQGALVVEHIKGFKLFLSVTEAARLKFFNAPDKKPEQFEKYLACALALGVEKEWAAQFASMHIAPPSWYQGPSGSAFTPILFAQNLSSFSSKIHSSMGSVPSSKSGGGFSGGSSGGGFGGGGGGSW